MKKQDIQSLLEKLNIELDDIQRVKFENNSVLSLILNDNFDQVLYLQNLKEELEHLLGYFDRIEKDELDEDYLEVELESVREFRDNLVKSISDKKIDEITLEDKAKIKAYWQYRRILEDNLEY